MAITRSPYKGTTRKLVLAFDMGTTYSGVAYVLLDPGLIPEIKSVGRFLGHRTVGNFKIPSVMFYDDDGKFRGVKGAVDEDEAENLHAVRWWKMKLSRGELPATVKKHMTAELPKGKSIQDIFVDFIRYLFDSAKAFIQEREPMGKDLWESLGNNIDLVLSHPNGWEGREQEFLRKSVVLASVIPEKEALSRVSFITEGEATFDFCATNTKSGDYLEPGQKVLVVDAGGGTIDVSSYTVKSTSPLKVEEFLEPKCFYQGAEIVTARARAYAEEKFKNSKFDNEEDLELFKDCFDTGLKETFSESGKVQFVRFGSPRDNDPRCGIRGGKFTIPGSDVEKFFEPSVDVIVEGIENVTEKTGGSANTFVFLAGGFGASPWIYQEVGRKIAAQGLALSRPDVQTNKAVAVGSISHYLDRFVVGRVVRYTYGTPGSVEYDPSDAEHRKRSSKKYLAMTGDVQLDIFSPILFKGTRISGTQEFREQVAGISPFPPLAGRTMKFPIVRYTGKKPKPQWMDEEEAAKFKTLCNISVDISKAPCISVMSRLGFQIYIHPFEVIYIYGETEFKAQVSWKEGGVEKRSDAEVLYDNEGIMMIQGS